MPRRLGCSTTTRSRIVRSIRWRTHGMSAPISPGSRAYSCRTSVASAPTRRNAMRSRPGDTKAFGLTSLSTTSGLRQIDCPYHPSWPGLTRPSTWIPGSSPGMTIGGDFRLQLARQARRSGRDVVKRQRHRDAGVVAHQGNDVGDADMPQCLHRAVVQSPRGPARIRQANRHLVDELLALVGERRREAREHRLDLVGREADLLAAPLMRGGGVGRMPFAVDDDDGDLALALGQRISAGVEMRAQRRRRLYELWIMHPDLR